MASYKLLVPFLLKWEGGVANDKDDKGGLTNKGITYDTYKNLCSIVYNVKPSLDHFHSLSDDEVGLMVQWYWNQSTNGNQIASQMVAEAITTWRWGSGTLGLKWFQTMLNKEYNAGLLVDGIIGKKTTQFINFIEEVDLFRNAIKYRRNRFYAIVENDPTQKKFLKGWLNRLRSFASRYNEQEYFDKLEQDGKE
jgi:lysozyme family protein